MFGVLLLDRPEQFTDQDLGASIYKEKTEERKILIDDDDYTDSDNVYVYANDSDILESLIEYSDEFTSSEELNQDILKEDIEVEEDYEDIEPSTEEKNYQKIIKYIKKEGIESNINSYLEFILPTPISAIIGSFLKLFCSIMLVQGARVVMLDVKC